MKRATAPGAEVAKTLFGAVIGGTLREVADIDLEALA